MNAAPLHWNSPHLKMQNETFEITEGHKHFHFSLNEINRMFLRPCKNSPFTTLFENLLSFHGRAYILCITTRDNREFKIRINGDEKQLYINLIAMVRRRLQNRLTENIS